MIASMTGFASSARESAQGQLALELKTVNHRYLEFQSRIPEELRTLEPAMREAVTAKLTRGKVDCRLTFTPRSVGPRNVTPDAQAMKVLAGAAASVRSLFPEARALSVAEILHWPGVLADESLSPDRAARGSAGTPRRGARGVEPDPGARGREARSDAGGAPGAHGRAREAGAAADARGDQGVPGKARREARGSRRERPTTSASQQEVVLYAARIDVDEELSRLGAHIAEMRRVLAKGGACGKRLDFLCQELNREANTLGSKSVANEMTRIAVELKVLIEQMREQVQNIE